MEEALEKLLDEHKATILKYVSTMKDSEGESAEVSEVDETETTDEAEATEEGEDEDASDKKSLLRRNQELALILSHSQKTVNEQEVWCIFT
jgi:hypothetical protein